MTITVPETMRLAPVADRLAAPLAAAQWERIEEGPLSRWRHTHPRFLWKELWIAVEAAGADHDDTVAVYHGDREIAYVREASTRTTDEILAAIAASGAPIEVTWR